MIEPEIQLSVRRQCELLKVSRSGLYYEPVPTSPDELELMRRIDELHLKCRIWAVASSPASWARRGYASIASTCSG
jgi:hypothetical protein